VCACVCACVCVRVCVRGSGSVRKCGCVNARDVRWDTRTAQIGPRSEEKQNTTWQWNNNVIFRLNIYQARWRSVRSDMAHTVKSAASSTSHGDITPDLLSARTVRLWLAAVNRHAPRDRSLPRSLATTVVASSPAAHYRPYNLFIILIKKSVVTPPKLFNITQQ